MNVSNEMVRMYPTVASTHSQKFIQNLKINKGAFTKKAKNAGVEKPLQYAKEVLANPEHHTEKTRKQAQLAVNLQKRN